MVSGAATREVPGFVNWLMIICAITIGVGYAFGPPSLVQILRHDQLEGSR